MSKMIRFYTGSKVCLERGKPICMTCGRPTNFGRPWWRRVLGISGKARVIEDWIDGERTLVDETTGRTAVVKLEDIVW